jgi:hypothetical protein
MGWIGGKAINLTDVEINVTARNSVVAVQSLDGNPIRQSQRILISLGARSMPATEKSLPYFSEPVLGKISITAPAGMNLRAGDPRTRKLRGVAASYASGRYVLSLDRDLRTSGLVLDAVHKTPHLQK